MTKMVYYRIDSCDIPGSLRYKVVLVETAKEMTNNVSTLTPPLSFEQCIDYIRATTPMQFN